MGIVNAPPIAPISNVKSQGNIKRSPSGWIRDGQPAVAPASCQFRARSFASSKTTTEVHLPRRRGQFLRYDDTLNYYSYLLLHCSYSTDLQQTKCRRTAKFRDMPNIR